MIRRHMLIDTTAIMYGQRPSRIRVALPSLDVDDTQVISDVEMQLSFSQSDVMERAGGLSNPRFWSFTPLTPTTSSSSCEILHSFGPLVLSTQGLRWSTTRCWRGRPFAMSQPGSLRDR